MEALGCCLGVALLKSRVRTSHLTGRIGEKRAAGNIILVDLVVAVDDRDCRAYAAEQAMEDKKVDALRTATQILRRYIWNTNTNRWGGYRDRSVSKTKLHPSEAALTPAQQLYNQRLQSALMW